MTNHHCCRLNVFSFALAAGLTWAIGTFFLGIIAMHYLLGSPIVTQLATLYKGFAPTVGGAFWGALWAFIDGFLGGLIFAFIYNLCIRCCGTCRKDV